MYTTINFKTKKEFKEHVNSGGRVELFAPGIGSPKVNGIEYVEGPHYPQPYRWYANVVVNNGVVISIK